MRKEFYSLSVEGRALYDPVSDQAFVKVLRKYLEPGIKNCEVNANINQFRFAQAVIEALKESLKGRRS